MRLPLNQFSNGAGCKAAGFQDYLQTTNQNSEALKASQQKQVWGGGGNTRDRTQGFVHMM